MKKVSKFFIALSIPVIAFSQSAKVQTAWRNLDDYKTSKDVTSLMKAKEAIDLASNHEDTKEKAKTWVYRSMIYYNLFKNSLEQEEKKVPATVTKKNERITKAYGLVPTADFDEAANSLIKAVSLDKNNANKDDISMLQMQMFNDVNNLAIGKYSSGMYKDAMGFFDKSYEASKALTGKKDTNLLTNALICAQKEKDFEKMKMYNQKAIDEKVAIAYNYSNLYESKMTLKDTAGAMQALQAGRVAFPNDVDLMNRETDYLLSKGKNQEAIANLDKAIAGDPKNAKFYLAKGIAYYSLANPRDPVSKKDLDKPKNYDEIMGNAENSYKKANELDPKLYEAWYNLGTLYNNWSTEQLKRCDDLIKQATKQKECEAKKDELVNKAIPAFEKAIELNPSDAATKKYLRRLYLMTGQNEKADKMK